MNDSRNRASACSAGDLASIIALEDTESVAETWPADELGEVLRHQLSAPLLVDLEAVGRVDAQRLKTLCGAKGLILKSFGDVLHHPSPPFSCCES